MICAAKSIDIATGILLQIKPEWDLGAKPWVNIKGLFRIHLNAKNLNDKPYNYFLSTTPVTKPLMPNFRLKKMPQRRSNIRQITVSR